LEESALTVVIENLSEHTIATGAGNTVKVAPMEKKMTDTVRPYRDPIPGRGSIELRRTAGGVYAWVITIWTDAIVTDNHLIGMVDSVQRVDDELRQRYPTDAPVPKE